MNYISQINSFERWLETNYLPISSQLLWYKLIALCNRCGWAEWVTVDNQRLMAVMQIKREATFIETRDKLISAGLVEYQKGKKGSPNRYKIYTFKSEVQTEVETEVYTEVETEVYTVVNTVDINKLNKTKLNNKKDISKDISKKKSCKHKYGEHKNVLLTDEELQKLKNRFKDYEKRIENLSTGIALKGYKYASHYLAIIKWAEKDKSVEDIQKIDLYAGYPKL